MDLFKNKVGRPSNDTLKRRKIFEYLIIAIVLLSIVFAALSSTLRINGTGKMSGKFSVHFEGYRNGEVISINRGYATSKVPKINHDKTELNGFEIEFYAPMDSVQLIFKIVNDGNINAEIGGLSIKEGTFKGNELDYVSLVRSHMTKSLKYVGGINDGKNLAIGDMIKAGEEQVVALTYTLGDFERKKLTSTVLIDDLETKITYIQSSNTTTSSMIEP